MRFTKKMRAIIVSCALLLTLTVSAVAVYAYDGTTDPLISLSYLTQFKANEIDPKLAALQTQVSSLEETLQMLLSTGFPGTSDTGAGVYTVVQLAAGQRVIAGESCEIILRSGTATVTLSAESLGGISDITAGVDLAAGVSVETNHLLLVPRNDGRGILITSEVAFIMIKGAYTIA